MLIRVCKGMACAMNGGGSPVAMAIEKELNKLGVNPDAYEVTSAHCLGRCAEGPCVRVNGNTYHGMHERDIPEFVRNELLPLIEK